jgi:23S rRNA pseudouridine1911/1915/1917 synthase
MSARARRSREAVTRIVRAESLGPVLTLASIAIHTGRTHQIRVHLSAIGHPIVGDSLYGGVRRKVPGDVRPVGQLERPFLHAAHLVFTHPTDGRRMDFTSPLPDDLQRILEEYASRPIERRRRIALGAEAMATVYKGRVFSVEVEQATISRWS